MADLYQWNSGCAHAVAVIFLSAGIDNGVCLCYNIEHKKFCKQIS